MTDPLPCGHPNFSINDLQMASDVRAACPCEMGYTRDATAGGGFHWRWIAQPARPGRDAPPAPRAADYGRERYG